MVRTGKLNFPRGIPHPSQRHGEVVSTVGMHLHSVAILTVNTTGRTHSGLVITEQDVITETTLLSTSSQHPAAVHHGA
jgi:hypothetical protein